MENKKTAVFGIYTTTNLAEAAVNHLMSAGFAGDDISVLMEDSNSSRQFAHKKNTKAPEGTATGATAGGVIGGTLGLLAGLGERSHRGEWLLARRLSLGQDPVYV